MNTLGLESGSGSSESKWIENADHLKGLDLDAIKKEGIREVVRRRNELERRTKVIYDKTSELALLHNKIPRERLKDPHVAPSYNELWDCLNKSEGINREIRRRLDDLDPYKADFSDLETQVSEIEVKLAEVENIIREEAEKINE